MTIEVYKEASEANKKIEFYSHLQKVLSASGMETLVSEELKKKFGNEIIQTLTEDLLPLVESKLAKAKQDFDQL